MSVTGATLLFDKVQHSTMISSEQRQEFAEQGYLVVHDVLDVAQDIESFKQAYICFLDALGEIYVTKLAPHLLVNYRARPFGERFAILLGLNGGSILQHIDPTLSLLTFGHQRRTDLPSAQRPELFHLMRNERLLDALEDLIGPEITISPNYHFNLKLGRRQLALATRIAVKMNRQANFYPLWQFHVGRAAWHTDAAYGLSDAHRSQMVAAWIPLTPSTLENGCLVVSPSSHRGSKPALVIRPESMIGKECPLPVKPGDVVLFDNHLAHSALKNRTDDDVRWAFNFRYLPTGEPTGRPFLPEFVGRSRRAPERELHDAELWSEMWRHSLDYLSRNPLPAVLDLAPKEAEAITARWRGMIIHYTDWLKL